MYGKAYHFTAEGRKKARDARWADAQREGGKLPHSTFFSFSKRKMCGAGRVLLEGDI